MFQSDTGQQKRGVIRLGLEAGGAWLGGLGIFASLLWLSSLMPARPSAQEAPVASAPATPEEKPKPRGSDTVQDPFAAYYEPMCFSSSEVIPFGVGMKRPEFLSGEQLTHTPEAEAARVQGLILARCTLTCLGEVKDCRILKPLPYMEQAAITVLEGRRYKPALYVGRPITVSYVFALKLGPPGDTSSAPPPRLIHNPSRPPSEPNAPVPAQP